MADMRIALYVYSKSTVTIDPSSSVDFMRMNDDYTAKFEATVSSSVTVSLDPGVYGFVFNGSDGVTAPGTVTLVTDSYDIQRKNPWPQPPPPPPPPFSLKTDWPDHCDIFLVPLGATFDIGTDVSTSRG